MDHSHRKTSKIAYPSKYNMRFIAIYRKLTVSYYTAMNIWCFLAWSMNNEFFFILTWNHTIKLILEHILFAFSAIFTFEY